MASTATIASHTSIRAMSGSSQPRSVSAVALRGEIADARAGIEDVGDDLERRPLA